LAGFEYYRCNGLLSAFKGFANSIGRGYGKIGANLNIVGAALALLLIFTVFNVALYMVNIFAIFSIQNSVLLNIIKYSLLQCRRHGFKTNIIIPV
jgi:hypothetical protein